MPCKATSPKKADIDRLFAETKKAFGQLDVLVNNAGIYEFLPLEQITEEHFHKQFNMNVLGLLLTTQEAVKYFGPAGGSVINISSVVSTLAPPTARSIAPPRGRWTPSPVRWPRNWVRAKSASMPSVRAWWKPKARMQRIHSGAISMNAVCPESPLGRIGQPQDIAAAVDVSRFGAIRPGSAAKPCWSSGGFR